MQQINSATGWSHVTGVHTFKLYKHSCTQYIKYLLKVYVSRNIAANCRNHVATKKAGIHIIATLIILLLISNDSSSLTFDDHQGVWCNPQLHSHMAFLLSHLVVICGLNSEKIKFQL